MGLILYVNTQAPRATQERKECHRVYRRLVGVTFFVATRNKIFSVLSFGQDITLSSLNKSVSDERGGKGEV